MIVILPLHFCWCISEVTSPLKEGSFSSVSQTAEICTIPNQKEVIIHPLLAYFQLFWCDPFSVLRISVDDKERSTDGDHCSNEPSDNEFMALTFFAKSLVIKRPLSSNIASINKTMKCCFIVSKRVTYMALKNGFFQYFSRSFRPCSRT